MAVKLAGAPAATGTQSPICIFLGHLEICTLTPVCKQQKDKLWVACRKL